MVTSYLLGLNFTSFIAQSTAVLNEFKMNTTEFSEAELKMRDMKFFDQWKFRMWHSGYDTVYS